MNSKEIAAELLQRGADASAKNNDGNTALHWATVYNNKVIAAKLLQCGSNFVISNLKGFSPLEIAFQMINTDILSRCYQEILSNPYSANDFNQTAFHISAKFCIKEVLDLLDQYSDHRREAILNNRDSNGNSSLHYWAMAISHNKRLYEEYGKMLIKMGAYVNSRNNQDQTPLHVAHSWEAVVVLLENGAWPNVPTVCSGDTPLLTRVKSLGSSSHRVYEGFCAQKNEAPDCSTVDTVSAPSIQEWQEVMEKGMDPWITNHKGESLLSLLVKNSNFSLVYALISFLKDSAAADTKHT